MSPKDAKTKTPIEPKKVDIIIVGGALTGQLLALVLKSRYQIALIDDLLPSENPTQKGGRALALTYASLQNLSAMGLASSADELIEQLDAKAGKVNPIEQLHISQHKQAFGAHFAAKQMGVSCLGICIEANQLISYLVRQNQVFLADNWVKGKVKSHTPKTESVVVELEDGQKLEASLVIFATGNQFLPKTGQSNMDFKVKVAKPNTFALVGTVDLSLNQNAHQRYSEFGVFALLPISPNKAAWILSFNEEMKNELQPIFEPDSNIKLTSSANAKIEKKWQIVFPELFNPKVPISMEYGGLWPIQKLYSQKIYQNRTLILGAGAISFSPIAAQGFNLTIADAHLLYKAIGDGKLAIEKLIQFAVQSESNHQKIQWFMSSLDALAYQSNRKKSILTAKILQSALFALNVPKLKEKFLQSFIKPN